MKILIITLISLSAVSVCHAQFETPYPDDLFPEPNPLELEEEEIVKNRIQELTVYKVYKSDTSIINYVQYSESGETLTEVNISNAAGDGTVDSTIFSYTVNGKLNYKVLVNCYFSNGIQGYDRSQDDGYMRDTIRYQYINDFKLYEITPIPYSRPYKSEITLNDQGNVLQKLKERGSPFTTNKYIQYNKQTFLLSESNKEKFFYDEDGLLLRYTHNDIVTGVIERTYTRNNDGLITVIKEVVTKEDGSTLTSRTEYKYEGDQMIEAIEYKDDKLYESTIFQYYENGLIKSDVSQKVESPDYKFIFLYSYKYYK